MNVITERLKNALLPFQDPVTTRDKHPDEVVFPACRVGDLREARAALEEFYQLRNEGRSWTELEAENALLRAAIEFAMGKVKKGVFHPCEMCESVLREALNAAAKKPTAVSQ